jgi:hypothetical protein
VLLQMSKYSAWAIGVLTCCTAAGSGAKHAKKIWGDGAPQPPSGKSILHHRSQSIKRNKGPNDRSLGTTPHGTHASLTEEYTKSGLGTTPHGTQPVGPALYLAAH